MSLDLNDPRKGQVVGLPGVAWELDGYLYNSFGQRVNLKGESIPDNGPKKAASKPKAAPWPAPPSKTVNVAGFEVDADMVGEQEPPDDFIVNDVNLSGWARGDAKYPFFKVRSAVQKEFGVVAANADEVREILVREGVAEPAKEAEAA